MQVGGLGGRGGAGDQQRREQGEAGSVATDQRGRLASPCRRKEQAPVPYTRSITLVTVMKDFTTA